MNISDDTSFVMIVRLLFCCLILVGWSQPSWASREEFCQIYEEKLKKAKENCDLEDIIIMKEFGKNIHLDCTINSSKIIIKDYINNCIPKKINQIVDECNIELLLQEEDLVRTGFHDQPILPDLEEMFRHARCNRIPQNCFQKELDRAITDNNWFKISEIEKTFHSEDFKDCPNSKKLTTIINRAKEDYFNQWILKKLSFDIEIQDFYDISILEDFVYGSLKNIPGFLQMESKFLKIKCAKLDTLLKHIISDAVATCDIDQILEIENLTIKKMSNCTNIDHESLLESFEETKRSYINKCSNQNLKNYKDDCDLDRILKLEKFMHGIQVQDREINFFQIRCFDLFECFVEDFKNAIHTCSSNQIQQLEKIINSKHFNECGNHRQYMEIFQYSMNLFFQECRSKSNRNLQKARGPESLREILGKDSEKVSLDNALLDAALRGKTDTVRDLLEKGAKVDAKDKKDKTALLKAVYGGHTTTIEILLENGANIEARENRNGFTALILAARKGHADVVKILLDNGADADAKAADGMAALIWATIRNRAKIVQVLLEEGAEVNIQNENHRTALIYAARKGYMNIVQTLINNGVDINAKDDWRKTALMWAAENGHNEIVDLLKQHGAIK